LFGAFCFVNEVG